MAFRGYRQFLEKDTAFTDHSTGSALLTIRGTGSARGPFDLCAAFVPGGWDGATSCYLGPLATTGEWAHVTVERSNYDVIGCGPGVAFYRSFLVPVASSGAAQELRQTSYDPCPPESGIWDLPGNDVLAWRADGAVAWVGHQDYSYSVSPGVPDSLNPYPHNVITPILQQTRFEQVRVVSGVPLASGATLNNRLSYALGWRSDGSSLVSYEQVGFENGSCERVVRAGLAPDRVVADSTGPVPWCGNPTMEPLAAPRLMRPLASTLQARAAGRSGPVMWTPESRLRAPRRRTVQPMVLVN